MFDDTDSVKPSHLNASAKILNSTVTQSSRCLFQLQVSEPHTDATGCSSSDTESLLLPTPLAVEREHPERVVKLKQAGADRINSRVNGEQRPNGIIDFMQFYGMLPTPLSSEGEKYTNTYNQKSQMGKSLSAMAGSGLLPTPRSNIVNEMDLNNPKLAERNKSNLEEAVAKMVVSQVSDDGTPSRLSPLFTEEMMGFPFLWTALPFLPADGAENP